MGARRWSRRVMVFVAAGGLASGTGSSGQAAEPTPGRAAGVVRVGPTSRAGDLSALPPSQVLEFPRGSHFTVAQVRGLAPLAARLRSVTGRGVLRQPLSGPTLPVTRQTERRQLETAPDQTVLQLPDGRRMTVGQFKAVLPSLPAPQARSAPTVVKVPHGTTLAELLKRPDSDVLESPGGKRTTVGELRRFAQSLPPGIRR